MPAVIPYAGTPLEELSVQVHSILQRGGVVAVPTETFYGLAVNPFDHAALDRLCAVKGRAQGTPILVLVAASHEVSLFAEQVPAAASMLMEAFWPGPLTLLFPARAALSPALTGGTGRVGIRRSPCRALYDLLQRVGPMTGTSANRSGMPPACTAREVEEALGEQVDAIIDAGPTPGGLPSTVAEVDEGLRVVREGAIPSTAIEATLAARGISLKRRQM